MRGPAHVRESCAVRPTTVDAFGSRYFRADLVERLIADYRLRLDLAVGLAVENVEASPICRCPSCGAEWTQPDTGEWTVCPQCLHAFPTIEEDR